MIVFDEPMPGGSSIHAIMRKIASNETTGMTAIAIAILSAGTTETEETIEAR
jgi:hypothetical protein